MDVIGDYMVSPILSIDMQSTVQEAAQVMVAHNIGSVLIKEFEEFMDIALYSGNGYYSKPASFGVYGDYYTRPSLHPFFGYLFAIQIMNIWEYMDRPNPFTIVEIGAGDGTLAIDIVSTIRAANIDFTNCLQ